MNKLKDAAQEWLENDGYALGYDWDSLPDTRQWKNITVKRIYRRQYGKRKNVKDYK